MALLAAAFLSSISLRRQCSTKKMFGEVNRALEQLDFQLKTQMKWYDQVELKTY